MSHLFLVGYRGTGKSTVASKLAKQLNRPWLDTDREIERIARKSIREIFEEQGESGFRLLEQQVLQECVSRKTPSVMSLGGGAVLNPENRRLIQAGFCVWLKGSPEVLYERISEDQSTADSRPRLTDRSGYDEVVELLATREPLYAAVAQFAVMTDELSPDEIVLEITDWLRSIVRDESSDTT